MTGQVNGDLSVWVTLVDSLKLAVANPLTSADEDRLRDWLHLRSGYAFPVRFSYAPEIPRGPADPFQEGVHASCPRALTGRPPGRR